MSPGEDRLGSGEERLGAGEERLGAGEERLLAELSALLRAADPVPAVVVEAARASIGWRTLESELAQLTATSSPVRWRWSRTRSGGSPSTACRPA
jgi:hypothetical protein